MASSRVTGSESLSHYTACELHVDEEVGEFCSNHNVLLCSICVVTNHFSCTRSSIKDTVKERNQKESVDVFIDDFQILQTKFKTLKSELEGNKLVMINQLQGCYDGVRQIRQEINRLFDRIETDFIDSIKQIEQEQLKHADCRLTSCKHSIEQIDLTLKKLKHCRTINDDEVLFIQKHRWIPVYERLQEAYSNMDESVKPNLHTEIVKDKHIVQMSEEVIKMGQVVRRQELILPADSHLWVTGSAFLPDGRLVICIFYPETLVMYGIKGLQLSALKLKSCIHQIAVVTENILVGTVPTQMQIHFVHVVENNLEVVKKIETELPCYGIDVQNNELYATAYDNTAISEGAILVLSMEGEPLRRFTKSFKNEFFIAPCQVCVNRSTSCVYVIEGENNRNLTLLPQGGRPLDRIEHTYFDGICRDSNQDRIFLLRSGTLTIVVGKTFISKQELFGSGQCPCNISYRQRDRALFVGYIRKNPTIYFLND